MRRIALLLLLMWSVGAEGEHGFEEALQAAQAGNHEAALEKFEGALEADPNNLRYGSEYRQSVIALADFDRSIAFFEKLVAAHPEAPNAWLNFGYAFVDKIPAEGAITQVLLANTALTHFSAALELEESWLGYFTRGNSYLFWPAIFGRTPLAIADMEKANELAGQGDKKDYHVYAWIGLGDCYWRLEDMDKAREIWQQADEMFPGNELLQARLGREGEELNAYLEGLFDATQRVDTTLRVLWEGQ